MGVLQWAGGSKPLPAPQFYCFTPGHNLCISMKRWGGEGRKRSRGPGGPFRSTERAWLHRCLPKLEQMLPSEATPTHTPQTEANVGLRGSLPRSAQWCVNKKKADASPSEDASESDRFYFAIQARLFPAQFIQISNAESSAWG